MTKKKFDLLTLTEISKAVGVSQTAGRRLVKRAIWKPDARASNSFLFLPSRVPELKNLIHAD